MPNWPMKSVGRSPACARFELSPMTARKRWTSSSVSPMPLSAKVSVGGAPVVAVSSIVISPAKSRSARGLPGADRVDAVLQQLPDEHLRAAVEVIRQEVDQPQQMHLELMIHGRFLPGRHASIGCHAFASARRVPRTIYSTENVRESTAAGEDSLRRRLSPNGCAEPRWGKR